MKCILCSWWGIIQSTSRGENGLPEASHTAPGGSLPESAVVTKQGLSRKPPGWQRRSAWSHTGVCTVCTARRSLCCGRSVSGCLAFPAFPQLSPVEQSRLISVSEYRAAYRFFISPTAEEVLLQGCGCWEGVFLGPSEQACYHLII